MRMMMSTSRQQSFKPFHGFIFFKGVLHFIFVKGHKIQLEKKTFNAF